RHLSRNRSHLESRERIEGDAPTCSDHGLLVSERRPGNAQARAESTEIIVLIPAIRVLEANQAGVVNNGTIWHEYAPARFCRRHIDFPAKTVVDDQVRPDAPLVLSKEIVLLDPHSLIP